MATSALAFVVFATVIASYAGLIPLGHWQDEYLRFRLLELQSGNLASHFAGLLAWSPRPLSEFLIVGYGKLVLASRQQFIGPALAISWAVLAFSLLGTPILLSRGTPQSASARNRVLLAMSMFCLFLLCHPVSEMFYWPMAALAYVTCIAAIAALFWLLVLHSNESDTLRWIGAIAMTVAATAAEAGAIFVMAFCGMAILAEAIVVRQGTPLRPRLLWLALPLLVAACVVVSVYRGRVSMAQELLGDPAVAHHVLPVISKASLIFVGEMIAVDGREISIHSLSLGLVIKGLFFAGVFGTVGLRSGLSSPSQKRALAILSLACFVTSFVMICASLYQFGSSCCERHKTFRLCLDLLAFASAAALMAIVTGPGGGRTRRAGSGALFIGCLLASVLLAGYETAPKIVHDYRSYPAVLDGIAQNWKNGMSPGDALILRQWQGGVIGGPLRRDDTYTLENSDWWILSVMQFFKKKSVTFVTEDH